MSYDDWSYYKTHIISATSTLTAYQVQLTVYYGSGTDSGNVVYLNSHCNTNFSDIRFTNSSGASLPYWIESYTSGNAATIWVKIDTIAIAGSTIKIYYGNSSAISESSGTNTFTFFDDFTSGTLNTSLWTTPTSYSISNSILTLNTSSTGVGGLYSQSTIDFSAYIVRAKHKVSSISINNRLLFAYSSAKQSTSSGTYQAGFEFYSSSAQLMTIQQGTGLTNSDLPSVNNDTNYYTSEIRKSGSTVYLTSIDSSGNIGSISSSSYTNPTVSNYIYCEAYTGQINYIDYILARVYTSSTVTHSTWSSEFIIPKSSLLISISQTTGVIPLTPTFTITSSTGLANFKLLYGDGNSYSNSSQNSFSTTHTYTHFGTYNVYTEGYYNSTLYSSYVTVTASNYIPTSSFTFVQSNNTISFTNTSQYSTQTFWEFGDSTYSEVINPIHTYTQVGTYNIKLYSSNDHGNSSTTQSITISSPTPTISFTYTRKSDTNSYRFIPNITTIPTLNETISSILWNFGDGSTSTLFSPSHIFTTFGSQTVTITVTNNYGNSSTSTQTITTTLLPIADFNPKSLNIITDTFPCRVQFTNLSYPTYDTSLWSFGDSATSSSTNPYNDYATIGTYNVSLTVSNTVGSSTKTSYNCIKIHNESKEFIEKLQYADSNNHFDIHILTETIYPTDSMIHAHVFTEVASYTQKEIPDKPGIDEYGNLNLYNNINEFGEFIIGSLTEQAKRLLTLASSIDKTGFTHMRAMEFDETVYYDSRFDESAT